ncbi:MAG: hypothetical protein Q8J69_10195 [Sphingobacteriaceae bacterium]|nr:hypothetical protein [Sphingobacteriaceae bacterium]
MKNTTFNCLVAIIIFCLVLTGSSKAQLSLSSYTARYDSLKPFLNTGILLDRSPLKFGPPMLILILVISNQTWIQFVMPL